MGSEGADGALGGIAAINIRGYELVGAVPVSSDDLAIFCTSIVVEDLVFNKVAMVLERGHDAGVGGDVVGVVFGLEGFDKDKVGVAVIGEHDVLVAAVRTDGEAAHVIGENLANGLDPNMKLVGLGVGKRDGNVVDG